MDIYHSSVQVLVGEIAVCRNIGTRWGMRYARVAQSRMSCSRWRRRSRVRGQSREGRRCGRLPKRNFCCRSSSCRAGGLDGFGPLGSEVHGHSWGELAGGVWGYLLLTLRVLGNCFLGCKVTNVLGEIICSSYMNKSDLEIRGKCTRH